MNNDVVSLENCLTQPNVVLPHGTLDAIEIFTSTPRKNKLLTTWFSKCTAGPAAAVFFRGPRESNVHRVTACDIAASAYLELCHQDEVEVINPSLVLKVRGQAKFMSYILPRSQHLPSPANTQEFRAGLESLSLWKVPVTAPTSRSGDPFIRALTLALAQKFADAFVQIPVEYIHHLVTVGWPARSLSATRRVLTIKVIASIKNESEKCHKREQVVRSATTLAIQTASSTLTQRGAIPETHQQSIESLESEIARIKQGGRRFVNDAARLRATQLFDPLLEIRNQRPPPSP